MGVVCNECRACIENNNRRNNNNNTNRNNNRTPISSSNRGNIGQNKGTQNNGYSGSSGNASNCYTCNSQINQRPETGRDDFRIQLNCQHHGDHSCDEQLLTMVFNYPVNFISCSNGSLISSNNSTRIQVKLRYHNNPNDHIGMGDFIVKSTHHDLQIVNCYINDGH